MLKSSLKRQFGLFLQVSMSGNQILVVLIAFRRRASMRLPWHPALRNDALEVLLMILYLV